jgi:aerobic carbon-monoxide dehydrogenase medium subunit
VATLLTVQAGKITHAAIAAAGIASKAIRLTAVEQAVVGQAAAQATFDNAGQVAFDTIKPTGDVATSAEYRRDLLRTLVTRTMADATNAAAQA